MFGVAKRGVRGEGLGWNGIWGGQRGKGSKGVSQMAAVAPPHQDSKSPIGVLLPTIVSRGMPLSSVYGTHKTDS